MNKLFDLNNKVAIVTGGYGHLGVDMVQVLASAGAKVIVAGRSKTKYNKAFSNTKNIFFEKLDISDVQSIANLMLSVNQKFGGIDIVINNAFYSEQCLPENKNYSSWNYGIEGVLSSTYKLIEESIPYLKKSKQPRIINIASMYGVRPPDFSLYFDNQRYFNPPSYGTAKAGVIHLTKYYAKYLAQYKIIINSISPGPFPSEEIQKEKDFISALSERSPLKRIGKPDELQGIILLLSSQASSYITGQNIVVDGGWTI